MSYHLENLFLQHLLLYNHNILLLFIFFINWLFPYINDGHDLHFIFIYFYEVFSLIIKSIHIKKTYIICISLLTLIIFLSSALIFYLSQEHLLSIEVNSDSEEDYIKWVDFTIPCNILKLTSELDINSHNNNEDITYNWIELLAYLACIYGGNFDNFKSSDLDKIVENLKSGKTIEDLTSTLTFYDYYLEAYSAVLSGFIGTYSIETLDENNQKVFENRYGLKAFLPIAKNYYFTHYKDFGNSRSYGFRRTHLGNDLMGSIGTPIIAVESGIVEQLGWNQYGGWRIGIRSFDGKRYYYYAHLRKDHPYVEGLEKGDTIKAGDVIGYLGMTGYSIKENVNNINVAHLHFGMQLIFDESQVDSPNEIWIDVYEIIEFLKTNTSEVYLSNKETMDYARKYDLMEEFLTE